MQALLQSYVATKRVAQKYDLSCSTMLLPAELGETAPTMTLSWMLFYCFSTTKLDLRGELLYGTLFWHNQRTLIAVVRSELEALQALAHLSRATEADSSRQGCHYVERRRHP